MILSPFEKKIKEKIENSGKPLEQWDINIYRGILTGYNKAFIIDEETKKDLISALPKAEEILIPILLGKNIKRYGFEYDNLYLINSHNGIREKNIPPVNLEVDYPAVFEYMLQYKEQLIKRYDKGSHWSNLRNCAYLEEFGKMKIAWGNLALNPQFCMIPSGYMINAPSPFFTTDNLYLLAVLNSKVADFYIKRQGVTRNGGYMEYKPMFVQNFPVPDAKESDQVTFISLVENIHNNIKENKGTAEIEREINDRVADLYNLTSQEKLHIFNS